MSECERSPGRPSGGSLGRGPEPAPLRLPVFKVDHPALEPFDSELRSIVRMAFTGGLQALASLGRPIDAIKVDERARSKFLRGCHRGYDKAQQRIGALVIELHNRIDAAQVGITELRRQREDARRKDVELQVIALGNRQLALRRIADAMLVAIVHSETWIIRRLSLDRRIRPIDPIVLRKTLAVASGRNSDDRSGFSLVSDLTTSVQIGDLIEISFGGPSAAWKVVELKEGRINDLLSGRLDSSSRSGEYEKAMDQEIERTLGKRAVAQAQRMRRQNSRMAEFKKIITTDRGIDASTNRPLYLLPDKVEVESYLEGINQIVSQARSKGFGAASIPGGLRLVALRRDRAEGGKCIGAVAHVFLHLRHPERECRLDAGFDEGMKEVEEFADEPVFIDLVAHSMHAQWGTPVYLWGDFDTGVDLAVGNVRIFAQFDLQAFFDFAARDGVQLSWVTGKEAERLKQQKLSHVIPGSPNARAIHAVTPDGEEQTLLSGFFGRVINELMTPRQLLDLIKKYPAGAARVRAESET